MASRLYSELQKALAQNGAETAIDRLIESLRERREYGSLFYAHLL
jgi:hypothetical protein